MKPYKDAFCTAYKQIAFCYMKLILLIQPDRFYTQENVVQYRISAEMVQKHTTS